MGHFYSLRLLQVTLVWKLYQLYTLSSIFPSIWSWGYSCLPDPKELQEQQYNYPYHHIPWEADGIWRPARVLRWSYEYLALVEKVTKTVLSLSPKLILDFGCGDGYLTLRLLHLNEHVKVVGVDISDRALMFARAFCGDSERAAFYHSIGEIPQNLLPFDVVIAMEVLEHIPPDDLPNVVEQVWKALRHDGWFVVSVPTTNIALSPKHYQHFSLNSLQTVLGGRFILLTYEYVHRIGLASKLIGRVLANRFVIVNNKFLLSLLTKLYRSLVMTANERNGVHLLAVFRRKED